MVSDILLLISCFVGEETGKEEKKINLHKESDIIIAYSAVPGDLWFPVFNALRVYNICCESYNVFGLQKARKRGEMKEMVRG